MPSARTEASLVAATCGVMTTFGRLPERAVRRQRLRLEHVEAGADQQRRSSSADRISASTCRPPRPAIDQHGAAERAVLRQLSKSDRFRMPRVSGVSGSKHDEDVGAVEERRQPGLAVKRLDARHRLRRPAPAGDLEAERDSTSRRRLAEIRRNP